MSFKNLSQFKKRLEKRLLDEPEKKLHKALVRSTNVVRNHAVSSIQAGGSGITYEKYNPRRTHTASAEGSPPASDTGTLASGISTEVVKQGRDLVGQIKAYAPADGGGNYALYLEFGTTKMVARPFMQPALDKNAKKITKIFKSEGVLK